MKERVFCGWRGRSVLERIEKKFAPFEGSSVDGGVSEGGREWTCNGVFEALIEGVLGGTVLVEEVTLD